MKKLLKPSKLNKGDTIATISPAWGCAGSNRVKWKYELGVKRLEELGLNVVAAPNSLKGTSFLKENPEARAEDLMWAFENKEVKAIIANVGGNDSDRILPFLSKEIIIDNPKILCGYSDVMNLHLFCYKIGLSTFYGDNLLTTIAEAKEWNGYSKFWFEKVLFDNSLIGEICPAKHWSDSHNNYTNPDYVKKYNNNTGYVKIQGEGIVRGKLFGGHSGLMEIEEKCEIALNKEDFKDTILFFEEIPEFSTEKHIRGFFDWLGRKGYLQIINGIIIGKIMENEKFEPIADIIREIVSDKYGLKSMPIMYGLNIGHTSPICVLPYGVEAEVDVNSLKFSILENGVV